MGNILLFLLGMRDNLGVLIGGMPLRFGELAMVLFSFMVLLKHVRRPNSKALSYAIFFMTVHLIVCIVSVFLSGDVQVAYVAKYLLRCVIVISFLIAVNHVNVDRLSFDFDKCMKYIVVVLFCSFLLEQLGYWVWLCSIQEYSGHGFMGINRFSGTASEPGYFLEVVIIPFYYYLKKNNRIMVAITSMFAFLTFSVGVYAGILLLLLIDKYVELRETNRIVLKKESMRWILIIVPILFAVSASSYKVILDGIYQKAIAFISGESTSDYSTMVRTQISTVAVDAIKSFNCEQWLFGKGLGGFYSYSERLYSQGLLFHFGESPDNAYLGIMYDSGILGLCTYLMVLFLAFKQKPKSIEAKSIYCAMVVSCLHNFILSGMWLYMIWVEMGLLYIINIKDKKRLEGLWPIHHLMNITKLKTGQI